MPQSKQQSRSLPGYEKSLDQNLIEKMLAVFIDPEDASEGLPDPAYLPCTPSVDTTNLLPAASIDNPPFAVIVIDVSGSMNNRDWPPSRLEAAKVAAIAYIERLAQQSPDATVAVVTFGSTARVICKPISVRSNSRIVDAIDRIRCGSATNLTWGLKVVCGLLAGMTAASGQVILLTDGHSTSLNRPDGFAEQIRQAATFETVGIGGSPKCVDEGLLKRISSKHPDGSPRYRWIGDREQLVEHFEQLAGRITR